MAKKHYYVVKGHVLDSPGICPKNGNLGDVNIYSDEVRQVLEEEVFEGVKKELKDKGISYKRISEDDLDKVLDEIENERSREEKKILMTAKRLRGIDLDNI
ncbi:MAG: hypothetical protein ACP5OG_01955 [Candidatus Nanoarchaeia archaeon]